MRYQRAPRPTRLLPVPLRRGLLPAIAALLIAPMVPAAHADTSSPGSAAGSSPSAPAGPTADQIAQRVQSFYDRTRTFRARFTQEYVAKLHQQRQHSEGNVVFEKPGKMSWEYDEPNGNRVVSDGHLLRVYERDNQQMYEQRVDQSYYPAVLSFLMGQGELLKTFTFRLLDSSAMKFEGGYVLEGTPKEATPAYQKVLLYVDGPTAQVRRVLILDAQGNRNRFDFSSPVVNEPVRPTEFTFSPPAGTEIIRP